MFQYIPRTGTVVLYHCTSISGNNACCFTTRTTSVGNNTQNVNITAVYSGITEHDNTYRAIISIPEQYRFVGKATGGATCNNAAVATSYDCTSNNSPKFNTQIAVQSLSSLSSNNLVFNVTVYRDQCQQSDSCPDVMVDSTSTTSTSSDDETIYFGPFGNVTKPVAIAIGVAFGVIIIGVAYAVLRRIFSGRSSGGGGGPLVRSPRNNANNNGNIIPMQSRGNDKDDEPDAAAYKNTNGNGRSNTLRDSRLWRAMSGNRGLSSNTGVVVDMGVEPATSPSSRSVSRSASRAASRQPSTHRSGTSRRTNAAQKSQTSLVNGASSHENDHYNDKQSASMSRQRSVHKPTDINDDNGGAALMSRSSTMRNKTAPSDTAMRRSKSTGKASTRSTSGHGGGSSGSRGNSTHRRTASSHDNASSNTHQRSRSRSSQRRPTRPVGDDDDEPSMPNNLDLALLSRKLNEQQQRQQQQQRQHQRQRDYDNDHDKSIIEL
ncbi:hypothetical protein BDF22DRAFT_735298 [Syncephalis plumigaleata]|nr:hypothetical protein BDF22DRAFT_735298 [Syncephalis plumigaleata]